MHTSPRESKAEIRNSNAPIRLRKTGITASSPRNALSCVVYILTLSTLCKSAAVSMERPSSDFAITCGMQFILVSNIHKRVSVEHIR